VAALGTAHRRRLREMWRGAGWPCHDPIELDLLAAGLLARHWDAEGRELLRVTDAGIQHLADARRQSQAAYGDHETLVELVAREMQRAGRVVWCGLSLRAPVVGADGAARWVMARPDVFSIRHTSVEAYVEPVVHEIKVSRSDLLADLRRPAKAQAYLALACQCWYVVRAGLCSADDVPPSFGLLEADGASLSLVRPAPRRQVVPGFTQWMELARASAFPPAEAEAQAPLSPNEEDGAGNDKGRQSRPS
jgi:hypothetical protein